MIDPDRSNDALDRIFHEEGATTIEQDENHWCPLDTEGERPVSATITVEEAQARLKELIGKLAPGEEVVITLGQQPVAKIVGHGIPARKPRRPGSARGKLVILEEDDEHLKDFKEYME